MSTNNQIRHTIGRITTPTHNLPLSLILLNSNIMNTTRLQQSTILLTRTISTTRVHFNNNHLPIRINFHLTFNNISRVVNRRRHVQYLTRSRRPSSRLIPIQRSLHIKNMRFHCTSVPFNRPHHTRHRVPIRLTFHQRHQVSKYRRMVHSHFHKQRNGISSTNAQTSNQRRVLHTKNTRRPCNIQTKLLSLLRRRIHNTFRRTIGIFSSSSPPQHHTKRLFKNRSRLTRIVSTSNSLINNRHNRIKVNTKRRLANCVNQLIKGTPIETFRHNHRHTHGVQTTKAKQSTSRPQLNRHLQITKSSNLRLTSRYLLTSGKIPCTRHTPPTKILPSLSLIATT